MTKYYYIPVKSEKQFKNLIDKWIESDANANIIIVGIYTESISINIEDTDILNKDINGNRESIKRGINDKFDNKTFELIGYCLEADLDTLDPITVNPILNNPKVLVFNTSEEFNYWKGTNGAI